jgi:hypothetical protein
MFEGSHVPLHKWFQACFLLSVAGDVISPYQLHLRLEVTNKTALGIVHRLAWIIGSAGSTALGGGQGLASQGQAVDRSQRPSRRRASRAPDTIGWDELPWMQFPIQPRRQFLRFVEAVREFGCLEDEGRFEQLLTMIGTNLVNRRRMILEASSDAPMALGFTGPVRSNLERVTA